MKRQATTVIVSYEVLINQYIKYIYFLKKIKGKSYILVNHIFFAVI